MPEPIDLQFDKISMSSSGESSEPSAKTRKNSSSGSCLTKESNTSNVSNSRAFFSKHVEQFKSKVMVSGSFYNIVTFSLLTFVVVVIVLVVFRPPLVLHTPKPTEKVPHPEPCLSWASVLTWSVLMGMVVAALAFFTRPKSAPNYVVQK